MRVLIAGDNGNFPICVKDSELGYNEYSIDGDDFFYSSGYDMSTLSEGWHHLAAVGMVSDFSTTTFYIDFK